MVEQYGHDLADEFRSWALFAPEFVVLVSDVGGQAAQLSAQDLLGEGWLSRMRRRRHRWPGRAQAALLLAQAVGAPRIRA